MLTNDEKNWMRATLAALKDGIHGFRPRRAQLEMIGAIANAFGNCREPDEQRQPGSNIVIVEAGTGTGKSYGALIPAIVLAKSRGKRLVVSSSTTALQAQLSQKDGPALQAHMPMPFTFAVAKGRGRYACIAKLFDIEQEASQAEIGIDDERSDPAPPEEQQDAAVLVQLAQQFTSGAWNGDRDDLSTTCPDSAWSKITTDRQGCAGSKCPHFAPCPFYLARQRAKDADLVIANHDLVLAALSMDAGTVLPDPADTMFVFDEAHALPAKVLDQFAAKHTLHGAAEWAADVTDVARDVVLGLGLDRKFLQQARDHSANLAGRLKELSHVIDGLRAFEEKRSRRFKNGVLPDWAGTIGGDILRHASALRDMMRGMREAILEKAQTEPQLAQRLLGEIGFYFGKVDNLVDTWQLMLAQDNAHAPTARWIEQYQSATEKHDYLICASPLSGGDKLCELLWRRASAVALTSASLTSCGSFKLFLQQTGLDRFKEVRQLQLQSPFDYQNRAQLVVPAMRSSPKNAVQHTREVIELLPGLMQTQGTLVLFASGKQMREVYDGLPPALQVSVLAQGAQPKMQIIAQHKAAIDRGDKSVIFGLASFYEGVDLPGAYCTHVILAKLPFSVPDTPLEQARREWIESRGGSAFVEITVPEAGVRLLQGVGRLLRTDRDYGTVTVLDKRLAETASGRMLLKGLPPFAMKIGIAFDRITFPEPDLKPRAHAGS